MNGDRGARKLNRSATRSAIKGNGNRESEESLLPVSFRYDPTQGLLSASIQGGGEVLIQEYGQGGAPSSRTAIYRARQAGFAQVEPPARQAGAPTIPTAPRMVETEPS